MGMAFRNVFSIDSAETGMVGWASAHFKSGGKGEYYSEWWYEVKSARSLSDKRSLQMQFLRLQKMTSYPLLQQILTTNIYLVANYMSDLQQFRN